MKKKRKLLILSLFAALSISFIPGVKSSAEEALGEQAPAESEMKDENAQRLTEVTAMDQDGNIFKVDETGGVVEDSGMSQYFRSRGNYQIVNFRTKGNATTSYTEAGTGVSGYTNGAYGADAAYLGMEGGKVKFMLSGVVGLVDADEVQVVSLSSAKSYSCYKNVDGRLLHYITQDMTTPGHATALNNGPAPSYLSAGTTYYSYDGHYFYTDYGTMLSDYQNNTRSQSVNAGSPYYNYYQYLQLRSRTSYSGDELNGILNSKVSSGSKMRNTGNQFVSQQDTYGINALIMSGIAANESGWGTSSISQSKNNLFGLNAVDSSPGTSANTYASVDECIRQFADGWMSRGYVYPGDWRYKGGFLGNKGSGLNVSYASDPYWGEKAANIIWTLDNNGGGRDSGKYTIGIKDTIATGHSNVNVRNAATTASPSLYMTGTHSNYAVIILDAQAENSFYRIQSDAVLNGDRTAAVKGVGEYNFDNMYAYMSSDYLTVVNQGSGTVPEPVAKELQEIYISAAPSKTSYIEGETFDAAGMTVMAKWSDGTESDVTAEAQYPTDALTLGTTSISIQYTADGITMTASQPVTVNEKPVITEISIDPASVEMKPGESRTFGKHVAGTGNPSRDVTWSVEGGTSADTKIETTGKLQIGADETADKLTVKIISVADSTKEATASVTVIKEDTGKEENNPPEKEEPSTDPDTKPEPGQPGNNGTGTQDEIKDENTGISISGVLPDNVKLKIEVIGTDDERYTQLTEALTGNKILGVYDINPEGLEEGTAVELIFTVDPAYNGREVEITHYKEVDGKLFPVSYSTVVKDGKAAITVTGFSPYVLSIKEDNTGDTAPPPDNSQTNDNVSEAPGPDNSINNNIQTVPPSNGALTPPPNNTSQAEPGNTNNSSDTNTSGTDTTNETTSPQAAEQQPQAVTSEPAAAANTPAQADQTKVNVKKAPKTGDTAHLTLWMVLMMISTIGIAVVYIKTKKKKAK